MNNSKDFEEIIIFRTFSGQKKAILQGVKKMNVIDEANNYDVSKFIRLAIVEKLQKMNLPAIVYGDDDGK
jgi:hypothetical protein